MSNTQGLDLEQIKTQAKELLKQIRAAQPEALDRLRQHHPEHKALIAAQKIQLADAQLVIGREQGFTSWAKLKEFAVFRQTVRALDAGDIPVLVSLIEKHPFVLTYRCQKGEWYEEGYFAGATLLNHVAGNPIRCPLPANILEVTRLLLDHGAQDQPSRPKYTVGLILTSKSASEAGVALPLIDMLVEAQGLEIDFSDPGILNGPLLNQAPETVQALLRRGARLDLPRAAAVGRFDLVQKLMQEPEAAALDDGLVAMSREAAGARKERNQAFLAACMRGYTEIAEYMLSRGAEFVSEFSGQTGFHLAALNGHLDTVLMLIRHRAPLEIRNSYGGTVLGQTLWSAVHEPRPAHAQIVSALVMAGARVEPSWSTGIEEIDLVLRSVVDREAEARSIWMAAQTAVVSGDEPALARLLADHGDMLRKGEPPSYNAGGLRPDFSGGDEQGILVSNHDFSTWEEFEAYRAARGDKGSAVGRFEDAADAVVDGDVKKLRRMLREDPGLIRARSTRKHHSTLLHYVGANGVESYRQKTPKNAVGIARILLEAGADMESVADMYGGSTTLGLIATSIHPVQAGVQKELMDLFMSYGAHVDGGFEEENQGGYTHGAVNGCLANGRGEAAEQLAANGAHLDLEAAAGVGRLDIVRSFFDSEGRLQDGATEKQVRDGFAWACEYGRLEVAEFLLDRGVPVDAALRSHGQTGLHWAASCGQVEVASMLLKRGAPIDALDETFHGTPLSWVLYGWQNAARGSSADRYLQVVSLLVAAGAGVQAGWLGPTSEAAVYGDERMVRALRGEG